jgi:hypothetical protein
MNLKSAAMATGLVLTFAAGAWLSTIMLAPPQRLNRIAVQEQPPVTSPQPSMIRLPQSLPERLPDTAASDSILPPLPPLPPTPVATPPAPTPVAEPPVSKAPAPPEPEQPPPAEQAAAQPPEPPPVTAEASPTMVEAPPELQPVPAAEAAPEPLAPAIPLVPVVETIPEASIDPGIAALSDLVTRAPPSPSAPPPPSPVKAASSAPVPPAPIPATSSAAQPVGPYFTIQVGSFQDPANAASLARSLGVKGWDAFVVDWAKGTGQIWKVVRVGRYQTEAQAVSASAELTSAANLRGNVIKVR